VDCISKLNLPAPVGTALRRVEAWRKTRAKGSPMPDKLWEEAADLARRHGINPIARALRLEYYALKHHVEGSGGREEPSRPAFVEVSVSPPSAPRDCVVEMERADGARMRVRLTHPGDLVTVTDSFWRYRA